MPFPGSRRPTRACAGWSNVVVVATPNDFDPRPEPPTRPLATDCCGGGCSPCIFEIYESELERYEKALSEWRARHVDRE